MVDSFLYTVVLFGFTITFCVQGLIEVVFEI